MLHRTSMVAELWFTYCHASSTQVIKESMRMYPPFTVSRRLVQEGGLVLSGYQIPAGTEVNVGCYILLIMVVD